MKSAQDMVLYYEEAANIKKPEPFFKTFLKTHDKVDQEGLRLSFTLTLGSVLSDIDHEELPSFLEGTFGNFNFINYLRSLKRQKKWLAAEPNAALILEPFLNFIDCADNFAETTNSLENPFSVQEEPPLCIAHEYVSKQDKKDRLQVLKKKNRAQSTPEASSFSSVNSDS